jgi:chromosome segregation ATPase
MNKFYVIFPTCLLIAFGVYYTQFAKPEMAANDLAAAKLVVDKQADEAHRLEIEKKAQEDARRQQAERDEKDRVKQEKAQREKDEQDRRINEETARLEGDSANLTKQITNMQNEIANLRSKRENLSREVFDSAAKVELAKIDRRNAELEIQRMYEMVAQKVTDSTFTKLPPPPPTK